MSVFTWWAVIFGVSCGLLTFLPDEWVFVWVLSSVPFYIYLFCCYQNYLLFYEQVESVMESEVTSEEEILCDTNPEVTQETGTQPSYYTEMAERIKEWVGKDGYVRPGLTIKELSDILQTNRTYLSAYIKTTYRMTFRIPRLDCRAAHRICEASACAVSGIDGRRYLGKIRLPVPEPFHPAVQGKCRLYPCQMEENGNETIRCRANGKIVWTTKNSLNDKIKMF